MTKIIAALIAFSAFSSACDAEPPLPPTGEARGAALFGRHCKRCHGVEGTGNFLKGIPPNRSTDLAVHEIVQLVTRGRSDFPRMPHFEEISKPDARRLAEHVQLLKTQSNGGKVFWMTPATQ